MPLGSGTTWPISRRIGPYPWGVQVKTLASLLVLASVLTGCMTGQRPRLVDDPSATPLTDANAQGLVDVLTSTSPQPFTISYDILTKFGGQTTKALVTGDATHGTAVVIAAVKYVFLPDGQAFTCDTATNRCSEGVDETRISDRQLTSRFFKESAISRVRQDARIAAGEITSTDEDVTGTSASCIGVPVIDGNGATQTKRYCAFSSYGLLASMDTADLLISATSVASTADLSYFEGLPQ